MASGREGVRAIPLCLPGNYKWDPKTMTCTTTRKERSHMYVVKEALKKLREIKGPVCVVSITGPYRMGKSYILSEAFHQPNVFSLGHTMDPETVGIWMWILPEKLKDRNDQEVSVVLLDTEGTKSAQGTGFDDHQIFTLTVLISSVLIYNSSGVANRDDLEGLDFIVNLSQRIQVRSKTECHSVEAEDADIFHNTFPFFVWLLRDVTLSLPSDCSDIKEYFLKKVFQEVATSEKSKKAARSILKFFSGFDAFALPLPTDKREVLHNIGNSKDRLTDSFLKELSKFQLRMKDVIVAKKSVKTEETVTGEGMAMLVDLYVKAINAPGAVPNIELTWDAFVKTKCSEAQTTALDTYKETMSSQLKGRLPCDSISILKSHSAALSLSRKCFMEETVAMSTATVEEYLSPLQDSIDRRLKKWHTKNESQTTEMCNELIEDLQKQHLDPIFQKLTGEEAHVLCFQDVVSAYDELQKEYKRRAKGAKDIIAEVFLGFHSKLEEKKKYNLAHLKRVKRYNQAAVEEKIARAFQEKCSKELQVKNDKLLQENEDQRKEMEDLITKQREERKKFHTDRKNREREHKRQMRNLSKANEKEIKDQRERLQAENEKSYRQNQILKAQEEKNLMTIQNYCDRISNSGNNANGAMSPMAPQKQSGTVKQTENSSSPQAPLPIASASKFITSRTESATARKAEIDSVQRDKKAIEEHKSLDRLLTTIAIGAPVVGVAVSAAAPPLAPIAAPVGAAVGAGAAMIKKFRRGCEIM